MTLPNVLTPCLIVSESAATCECLYGDGIRILQVCGDRNIAATLMLAETPEKPTRDSGFLAQTLAERPYFDDGTTP